MYICCADGIVQKFLFETGQVILASQQCESEIMDIKLVNDYDKKNMLIISLKNGNLKVFDLNLQFLFDIPSRFKYNNTRYIISLKNPLSAKDDTKGDLLLITEGNNLDMFTWIKPGIVNINSNHNNKEQNHGNNEQMQMQFQPPQGNNYGQRFQFKGYQ